jgi:DNA polymerase-3 subunit alpha
MCVVQLSDMTGQYEAVLFSETLAQYREFLVEGKSLVITVAAEDRPEGVNLRVNSVQALDEEAAKHQKALRIFLRDPAPLNTLSSQLQQRGESQVSFVVLKGEGQGEVEIELKERYRIDPRVAAAMRAVPGVVEVELV